jgi:uncharacterized membrane protein
MPQSTFAGHPLHPMLVVAPAALLPFGFVMDAMHRTTGKQSYADAAYYSLVGGLIGGLAAGTAGALDYMSIERNTHIKRTANTHALLNTGALAVTAANVMARRHHPDHQGGSVWLSGLAAAGVVISSWFGGHLVYKHGMRVEGVNPVADSPEIEPPGDEEMEHLFHSMEKPMPASGPVVH